MLKFLPAFLFICTLSLVTTPQKANAQMMFEPWLGYEIGNREVGGSSDDLSGYDFGLRAGVNQSALAFGVEYALGKLTVDASGGNQDLDVTDIGAFAMYRFSMLRVWFNYIFNTTAETEGGGEYKGDGIKLALGVPISGQLNLNFEKVDRKYKKYNGSSLGTDVKHDSFIIGLGLVF